MNAFLLVGVGGVLGALARFAVGSWISHRERGTLVVNVLGSLALGALTARFTADATLLSVFGTGFCGAFTTFSSFAVETVGLYEKGQKQEAISNAVLNLVGALLAVGLGGWLATTFV